MKNRVVRIIALVIVFVGLIALSHYCNFGQYLTLDKLQENRAYLEQAVKSNYIRAVLIYILIYAAVISMAFPGVPPLTIIGGFLFGFLPGGMYATVGATIGSSISFLLIRYVLSGLIRGKYASRLEQFNSKIKSHGVARYLLTMQLLAIFPFFIINTLAALASVSFTTNVWTTFVGSIPMVFVYSYAGRRLFLVESIGEIFSPSIIILFLLLILLVLLPVLLKHFKVITDLESQ